MWALSKLPPRHDPHTPPPHTHAHTPARRQTAITAPDGVTRRTSSLAPQVNDDEFFCWYASSKQAADGSEPLGKVPLSMILEARPAAESGRFEVDLGNRCLQLALDGVPKPQHAAAVREWVGALVKDVVGDVQALPSGHK